MHHSFKNLAAEFLKCESGATAVEYGILVATIALAIVVALQATGNSLSSMYSFVAGNVNAAVTP